MDPKKRQDIQKNLPAESFVLDQLRYAREFTDILGNKVEIPSGIEVCHVAPDAWEKKLLPNQSIILKSRPFGIWYGVDLVCVQKNDDKSLSVWNNMTFDIKNRQSPYYQDLYFELHKNKHGVYSFGYNECKYIVFVFRDNRVVYVPSKFVLRLANTGNLDSFRVKSVSSQYHYAISEADFIRYYQYGYEDWEHDYLVEQAHESDHEGPEDFISVYEDTLLLPVSTAEGTKQLERAGLFFVGDLRSLQFLGLDGLPKPKDFREGQRICKKKPNLSH